MPARRRKSRTNTSRARASSAKAGRQSSAGRRSPAGHAGGKQTGSGRAASPKQSRATKGSRTKKSSGTPKNAKAPKRPRGETREKIYRFVREQLLAGQPPTVREVQHAVGLKAVESARVHLARLVADGRLAKDPSIARGYRLPPGEDGRVPTARVPLLGLVQAGGLTAAIEAPEGHVLVAGRAVTRRADTLLALRVQGDSMKDAGILEDDVVIVRRDVTPQSGDIVVALVDGEATVKTLQLRRQKKGRVTLLPANPAYDPIVPDPERLEILGRVIEVRRSLGRDTRN